MANFGAKYVQRSRLNLRRQDIHFFRFFYIYDSKSPLMPSEQNGSPESIWQAALVSKVKNYVLGQSKKIGGKSEPFLTSQNIKT